MTHDEYKRVIAVQSSLLDITKEDAAYALVCRNILSDYQDFFTKKYTARSVLFTVYLVGEEQIQEMKINEYCINLHAVFFRVGKNGSNSYAARCFSTGYVELLP